MRNFNVNIEDNFLGGFDDMKDAIDFIDDVATNLCVLDLPVTYEVLNIDNAVMFSKEYKLTVIIREKGKVVSE